MTVAKDKNIIVGEDLSAGEEFIEVENSEDNGAPELEPLFADNAEREFRTRWRDIQVGFVDEPRSAVEQADQLVAQLMQRLAQSFSEQRTNLEKQWEASKKISTEELRIALQRYRSFFERLLSI